MRPARIGDLLERVSALLTTEAEKKGVTLVTEVADASLTQSLDPEQMTQVLVNTIINAIQASPSGTVVRVRATSKPDGVVIEVADEGHGVAPEHTARLFDPFFTTKTRGTGLGLAISQRIVLAHGGTILPLRGARAGTTFRIELPRSVGGEERHP